MRPFPQQNFAFFLRLPLCNYIVNQKTIIHSIEEKNTTKILTSRDILNVSEIV